MKSTDIKKIRKIAKDKRTKSQNRVVEIMGEIIGTSNDKELLVQVKFDVERKAIYITDEIDDMVYMTDEDYSRMIDSYVIEDYKAQDTFYSVIGLDDHVCNLYETLSLIRDMFPDAETVTVYHPNMESIEKNTEVDQTYV